MHEKFVDNQHTSSLTLVEYTISDRILYNFRIYTNVSLLGQWEHVLVWHGRQLQENSTSMFIQLMYLESQVLWFWHVLAEIKLRMKKNKLDLGNKEIDFTCVSYLHFWLMTRKFGHFSKCTCLHLGAIASWVSYSTPSLHLSGRMLYVQTSFALSVSI